MSTTVSPEPCARGDEEGPHLSLIHPPESLAHAEARFERSLSQLIQTVGLARATDLIEAILRAGDAMSL